MNELIKCNKKRMFVRSVEVGSKWERPMEGLPLPFDSWEGGFGLRMGSLTKKKCSLEGCMLVSEYMCVVLLHSTTCWPATG